LLLIPKAAKPLDPNCDRTLVVCDGSRLSGQIGISVDELIRFSTRFASVYSDPEVSANLNEAVKTYPEFTSTMAAPAKGK
jgi:phospholipid/cholesterol/gamma-HCH transport system substrate-binding protein